MGKAGELVEMFKRKHGNGVVIRVIIFGGGGRKGEGANMQEAKSGFTTGPRGGADGKA